jgi:hypothetical protein
MAIARTTDTDDDGTGTTGTIHKYAWLQAVYDVVDARWEENTTTSTGSQNNFDISDADVLRCNNASLLTLTGIAAPASPAKPGKRLIIYSVGAGQVDLANQSASSTAANRIINGVTGTISLAAGYGRAVLVYDDTTDRWRVIAHEQGAYITPTFAAGNFTSDVGSWTVASGDVTTCAYYLRGKQLTVQFDIITTSVSGTPAELRIGNGAFGGFTFAITGITPSLGNNAGGGNELCYATTNASATVISIQQADAGTWSNATDTTYVYGTVTTEVQ